MQRSSRLEKRNTMVQARKLVHTIQIDVRWGDMDMMGHVNNTVYFRYLEHARITWLESIAAPSVAQGEGPVLVAVGCSFRLPVVYPAREVLSYTLAPGRSSIPMSQEIRDATNADTLYAQASATLAWVDFARNKSVPLPQRVRALVMPDG
jgi:acyl-CoA thioester hydrolase